MSELFLHQEFSSFHAPQRRCLNSFFTENLVHFIPPAILKLNTFIASVAEEEGKEEA